jgi:hypothetical protein
MSNGKTPRTIAAVSGFYPEEDKLYCGCGAEANRDFWIDRRGDGSAWLTCKRCATKIMRVTADLMTVDPE